MGYVNPVGFTLVVLKRGKGDPGELKAVNRLKYVKINF